MTDEYTKTLVLNEDSNKPSQNKPSPSPADNMPGVANDDSAPADDEEFIQTYSYLT